ncbi:MAG: sigma-70 family RNA polymerase sigma factor [Planctomycetes bacterium]|nr:sigma-70 family RNA polymerase sigma factor [Planctomycetota bacterium]
MTRGDKTSIGGSNERFETTDWTCIFDAQRNDGETQQAALGELISHYWKPVYCYLRRKGLDNEAAKDLTQGFFGEVVLGRGLVRKADRTRGRFRSFLLRSLDLYVRHVHRAQVSRKRRPAKSIVSLEGLESFSLPEPADGATPEAAFNATWAATLLEQVLKEVEGQCRRRGEQRHWEVFRLRVLAPIMEDSAPPGLPEICARLGIPSAAKASNMIATVKRQFRAALVRRVRLLVASDAEVEAEIQDLMEILSAGGARFRGDPHIVW